MSKNILIQNTSDEFDEKVIKELDKIIGITEDNCKLINSHNEQIFLVDDNLNQIEKSLNHSYVLLNSMQTFCVNVAKNIFSTLDYINPFKFIKKQLLIFKKNKYNIKNITNENITNENTTNEQIEKKETNELENTNKDTKINFENTLSIFKYIQFKKNNNNTDLSKIENIDKNTEIIINKLNKLKELNNDIHNNLSLQNEALDNHNNQINNILNTTQNNIKIINELL